MPRTRSMGVASSSAKPPRVRSGSVSSSTLSVHSSVPSVATRRRTEENVDEAKSTNRGTPISRESSIGPAYNTRSAKRAHNDSPESPANLRRSKRHAGHIDISPTVKNRLRHRSDTSLLTPDTFDAESSRLPARTSTPEVPVPVGKTLSLRGRKIIDDEDTDASSDLSSPPASVSSDNVKRSPSHTTVSTQNDQKSPEEDDAQSAYPVVNELKAHLGDFPVGEIAYGRILPMDPSPHITVKGIGSLRLPLSDKQLVALRERAQEPFDGKFGSDWPFNSAHRLTSIITDDRFELSDAAEWNLLVSSLVSDVGAYLGFGRRAADIQARPRSLCLWEKGNIWRGYSKPHPEHRETWIGTILLILDHNCQGGEIAARYRGKDILFEQAAQGRFLIANHAGTWLDVMPLTEGYRLGLTYELYLADNPLQDKFLDILVDANKESQVALAKGLSNWISEIEQGQITNFPLIQTLDGEYDQHDLNIYSTNAEDRALVLGVVKAAHDKHISPQHGYTLCAYLVLVKATSKNYSTGRRVRYSIEWAATIEGQPRPAVKEAIVDPQGVLQKDRFVCGETSRQVTKTMSTTTKTLPCLMLVWEGGK